MKNIKKVLTTKHSKVKYLKKVLLMKPMTFMNNSGKAVSEIATFYKIPVNKIFIIHDDIDLSVSRLK